MKFTQEIKDKWLEALKSGKYIQGFTKLRNEGTYCCLGVLCDIHPDLTIAENGRDIDHHNGYDPLVSMLGKRTVTILYGENDRPSYREKKYTDYRNVIPLIEELSVSE